MLAEQIKKEFDFSLKSGNQLKRLVLGLLMTAIKNRELLKRSQLSKTTSNVKTLEEKSRLSDEEIIEAVIGEVKKRKESVDLFRAGGRNELAEKEMKEMEILKIYLPAQMTEAEIETEIDKLISETGASSIKDMGRVIGMAMAKLKGKADGDTVSRIVKKRLDK